MSAAPRESEAAGPSPALRQRIAALGLTLLRVTASGRARELAGDDALTRWLTAQPAFAEGVRAHWPALAGEGAPLLAVGPGCYLVPLPESGRPRHAVVLPHAVDAVLMIGPEALPAPAGPDTPGVDADRLVTPAQARRLASTVAWMAEDQASLSHCSLEMRSLSVELGESYEELSLLYKLSTHMAVNQAPTDVLVQTVDELREVMGLRWMGIRLRSDDPRLPEVGQWLYIAGVSADREPLARAAADELLDRHGDADSPVIIDDVNADHLPHAAKLGRNLLMVPLQVEGRALGMLMGGDRLDGNALSSVDSKLCDALGHSLAIFLENHMLYEDAQALFIGVLHALTSAIDAKDSYTHGHSERVALLARQLAAATGADEHTQERVYLAGLVHDVGKIGVPEHVLRKPGRLTDEEFNLIKMHPQIGATILRDIRQMQDLVPGVLYHHERFDGRGYPHGVAGHDVPLFGRLIGLADAFDAMSSHRTYRKALQLDQVLDEVRRCAGTQFDPALAEAFVALDFTPFHDLIARHQQRADAAAA